MPPQQPYNQSTDPYVRPAVPPQQFPTQPMQPAPQSAPTPYPNPAPQPSGSSVIGDKFPLISAIIGVVAVILFGVFYGIGLMDMKYYFYFITLVLGLAGSFLGFKSLLSGGVVDKLALVGLVVSLVAASMSLSFVIGQAMVHHKLNSVKSSFSSTDY